MRTLLNVINLLQLKLRRNCRFLLDFPGRTNLPCNLMTLSQYILLQTIEQMFSPTFWGEGNPLTYLLQTLNLFILQVLSFNLSKYVRHIFMRTVNVVFEDNEHKKLTRLKGDRSWHDFIMDIATKKLSRTQEMRCASEEDKDGDNS